MDVSKTYDLPKNLVRIGKPRTLSEAQIRHLQELQGKVKKFSEIFIAFLELPINMI